MIDKETEDGHRAISNALESLLKFGEEAYSSMESAAVDDRGRAVHFTIVRMTLLVRGVVALGNDVSHIQLFVAAVRTLYELRLDLIDLIGKEHSVDKYMAFSLVSRFRAAQLLRDAVTGSETQAEAIDRQPIDFADDQVTEAKVEGLRRSLWNGKWPKSWTGTDVFARAKANGNEVEHRRNYFLECQYTHAGPAGFFGLDENGLAANCVLAKTRVYSHYIAGLEIAFSLFGLEREKTRLADLISQAEF